MSKEKWFKLGFTEFDAKIQGEKLDD